MPRKKQAESPTPAIMGIIWGQDAVAYRKTADGRVLLIQRDAEIVIDSSGIEELYRKFCTAQT